MSAFLLTVNPAKWTDTEQRAFVDDQIEKFSDGLPLVTSSWLTRRTTYAAGDRVYLLRQGVGHRGILASGYVEGGRIEHGPRFDDGERPAGYVLVDWDAFVDWEQVLPLAELEELAPSTRWSPRSSGTAVSPDDEEALETAWLAHLDRLELTTSDPVIEPTEDEIARSYAQAQRKVRRHQRAFRQLLLRTYPHECAYCGVTRLELLEAAHLVADSQGGKSSTDNGRLLCANHHRALDSGLLRWDPQHRTFALSPDVDPVPPLPPG